MRGGVYPRGDKTWRVQWYIGRDENGKPVYHNKTVHGEKRDAQRELRSILTEIDQGKRQQTCEYTVDSYLRKWLVDTDPTIANKTLENYTGFCVKHIIPALGDIKLSKLKASDIQNYITTKLSTNSMLNGKGSLSAATVRHHMTCLRKALNDAVDWQILPATPMNGVKLPRHDRKEVEFFTEAELKALLNEASKHQQYYIPIFIAAHTGMRVGEVMALKWSAIDFERNTIHVLRAIESTSGKMRLKEETKNRKTRSVPVTQAVVDTLKAYKMHQDAIKESLGVACEPGEWVCAGDSGKLLNIETVKKYFPKACKNAGIKITSFHTLRHTHASILLNHGAPIIAVKERLGHSSIQVTVDLYGHLMRSTQDSVVSMLNTLAL